MDPSSFVIRISAAGGPTHALRLPGPGCVLGRSRTAQVRLPAPEVSGAHLRIWRRPDGLWVEDLGSVNGTRLAGAALPPGVPRPLPPEATLQIGPYTLTAATPGAAPAPADLHEGTATLAARLLQDLVAAGAAPPATVQVTTPDGVSHRCVLTPGRTLRIGRDPACDVGAADDDLSRHHAELRLEAEGAVVVDLGSKNGTWRGEERLLAPTPLRSGDLLRLGGTELLFEDPAEAWLEELEGDVPAEAWLQALEGGDPGAAAGEEAVPPRPPAAPVAAGHPASAVAHAPRTLPTPRRTSLGGALLLLLAATLMAGALVALYGLFG